MALTEKPIERPEKRTELDCEQPSQFPLTRTNFIIMAVSAAVIVLGFILMAGPGSTETEFNPDIFSTRRIIVGPLFSFLGFVAMAVGIIWRPRK